ncbi:unnamed protein product, partial [Rotaria sordida]
MIVAFLKHALLDAYDETEERSPRSEQLLQKPYLQYSQRRLKKYFSRDECFHLRESIKKYALTLL